MSKDIHKWSNGRYTLMFDEHTFFVFDNVKDDRMTALNVTKRLNEQQATIEAKNEYQRTLEAKIRRLKNRIKILEKAEGWQN